MTVALCIMAFILSGATPNYDSSMYVGYTLMILGFVVIYPAVISYRNNVGEGTITFGRALSVGLLVTVVACVCYSIAWLIVTRTVMPDFMDKYCAHMIDEARKGGASPEAIAKQLKMMEMYKKPVMLFLVTFCEPLPVGIPLSLICAAIIKKRKPQPQVA